MKYNLLVMMCVVITVPFLQLVVGGISGNAINGTLQISDDMVQIILHREKPIQVSYKLLLNNK